MTQPKLRKHPTTLRLARSMRRDLTPTEAKVWNRLRGRRADFKFRRQHPIGPYILDFYCDEVTLAVEIEGDQHAGPEQIRHDRKRTAWLRRRGIDVMRVPVAEVERSVEVAMLGIWEACEKRRGKT